MFWAGVGNASLMLEETTSKASSPTPPSEPCQPRRVCSTLPTSQAINGERKKKKGYFGILTSLWPGERLNSHDSLAAERQHFVARILGNAEGSSEGVSLIFKGGSQAPV